MISPRGRLLFASLSLLVVLGGPPRAAFADVLIDAWRQARQTPLARLADQRPENILDQAFAPLVDASQPPNKRYVGVWVGVISPGFEKTKGYGFSSLETRTVPVETTIFEIGSLTKAFTGILLARAVLEDGVKLDDPLAGTLPASVKIPDFSGKVIRLEHLATHTAGFPKMPDNFNPNDSLDPYRDYTADLLYAYLSTHALSRAPGEGYEYSNLGMGLLGHILSLRRGLDFGALIVEKIAGPLGLVDTASSLTPDQQSRMAQGYDWDGKPSKLWNWPPEAVMSGAGSLRSTGKDLMGFLKANLGIKPGPLARALELSHAPRHISKPGQSIGLGWHIDGELIWHNGATYGFRSFLGFDKKRGLGIVVLSNTIVLNVPKDDLDPRLDQAALQILRGLRR